MKPYITTNELIEGALLAFYQKHPNTKPLYLVFEGPDGSGKSSLSKATASWLGEQFGIHRVMSTCEMGGTAQGRVFREMVLSPKESQALSPQTETLLCWADRLEGQKQVKEWLANGCAVVQDRTYFSTYAYQGMLNGNLSLVNKIHSGLTILNADVVFVLDIEPEEITLRVGGRTEGNDRMDYMTDRQVKDLCRYYKAIEYNLPEHTRVHESKVIHLDARQSPAALLEQVVNHLNRFFYNKENVKQ